MCWRYRWLHWSSETESCLTAHFLQQGLKKDKRHWLVHASFTCEVQLAISKLMSGLGTSVKKCPN